MSWERGEKGESVDILVGLEQFTGLCEIKYILVWIPFEGVEEDGGGFCEQNPFTSAGGHCDATAGGTRKKGEMDFPGSPHIA